MSSTKIVTSGGTRTQTTQLFGAGTPAPPALCSIHSDSTNTQGLPTGSSDSDWAAVNPSCSPPVLRQTSITYTSSGQATVPSSVVVSDGSGTTVAQTTYGYDGTGDVTSENDYTSASNSLTRGFTYNANGTLATATDVNGAVVQYSYDGANGCYSLLPTEIKSVNIPGALDTKLAWGCTQGVLVSSTDVNGAATQYGYTDPLWRPTTVTAPDGGTTVFHYAPGSVDRAMLFNSNNSTDEVLTTLDSLGRPYLTQRRQGPSATLYDTVTTFYDALGRATGATLPCAAAAGTACGTQATTTSFDALSRPVKVTDFGGGETDISYLQNYVLTTIKGQSQTPDIAKQERLDGLGRLAMVCEQTTASGSVPCGVNGESGYQTVYTHDAAGRITNVNQSGQTRSFSFDQLGRLTSETNPETGTTAYTFDSDTACGASAGDLVKRIDADENVTCYAHDALHRVTGITYPSGPNASATPPKTFVYDAATVNGVAMQEAGGRLAEAYTGNHTTDLGFGYKAATDQAFLYQLSPNSGGWYSVIAGYYQNGMLGALNLNALPQFQWGQDTEGRLADAGQVGLNYYLANATTYTPAGQPTSVTLGSGDSDSYGYDAATGRMTDYRFTVNGISDTGVLSWNKNGTLGSLVITDNVPGTADTQACDYSQDALGRLAGVDCGSATWSQTFSYDAWGNISKTGTQSFGATYANNRIVTNGQVNGQYDHNGNLLNDPVQSNTVVNAFDAEGRPVTLEGMNVTYDALGRAVEAQEPSGPIEFVYGPDGGKLAVMSGQTLLRADVPLPGGGEAVYNAQGLAYYRHADHLGSSRLASTPARGVYAESAYAPFGENYQGAGATDLSFTGQKQDTIGGQYDFLLREYNPIQGRWWTPDPAGRAAVNPNNPQSWNRYAYVGNNPLMFVDPLGLMQYLPPGCYNDPVDGVICPPTGGGSSGGNGCSGGGNGPATLFVLGGLSRAADDCGGDGGGGRQSGGQKVGPPPAPPLSPAQCENANNFVQRAGIAALGWLAALTGKTIGLGASGSVGSGFGIGAGFGVSRQIVVSPSGRAAFVTSYNFGLTPAGSIFGSGIFGGVQLSISGAVDPEQLSGISGDFSFVGASGFGAGFDASFGSVPQASAAIGFGYGGLGGAGLPQDTSVVPICGTGGH